MWCHLSVTLRKIGEGEYDKDTSSVCPVLGFTVRFTINLTPGP